MPQRQGRLSRGRAPFGSFQEGSHKGKSSWVSGSSGSLNPICCDTGCTLCFFSTQTGSFVPRAMSSRAAKKLKCFGALGCLEGSSVWLLGHLHFLSLNADHCINTGGYPQNWRLSWRRAPRDLGAYGLKCELFWVLFSLFLVVLLINMDPHSPVSEFFLSRVQHVATVKRSPGLGIKALGSVPKPVCWSKCEWK